MFGRFLLVKTGWLFVLAFAVSATPSFAAEDEASTLHDSSSECSITNLLLGCGKAVVQLSDPKQSLQVRVVGPTSEPVPDARLKITKFLRTENGMEESSLSGAIGYLFCSFTLTRQDGTARVLRPQRGQGIGIYVETNGYASAGVRLDNTRKPIPSEILFKLDKARPIGGVVRDESGRPVAGAQLILQLPANNTGTGQARSELNWHQETTDAKGRWKCLHTPANLEGLTIRVDSDAHVPEEIDLPTCAREREHLQNQVAVFVLKRGLVVRGRITDQQGKPLPSAQIEITQQHPSCTYTTAVYSNAAGEYRYDKCVAGPCTINACAQGFRSQCRVVSHMADQPPIDFSLAAAHNVTVRVVDADDKPVSGAAVSVESEFFIKTAPYLPSIRPTTDAKGIWMSAGAPDSSVSLRISKVGFAMTRLKVEGRKEEYRVVLRPAVHVSGRIVDATTKLPIEGIRISIKDKSLTDAPSSFTYPALVVEEGGRYRLTFGDLPENIAWQLCVQAPGYVTSHSDWFQTSGDSRTIDVELKPGPAVTGVVRLPDGRPAVGASVFTSTVSDSITIRDGHAPDTDDITSATVVAQTDANGRFAIPMPAESYVVGVVHSAGAAELSAAELNVTHEIRLQPWARVEGVLKGNSESKGALRISVNKSGSDPQQPAISWYCAISPDAQQRFLAERVMPGTNAVDAFVTESSITSLSFTSGPSKTVNTQAGHSTYVELDWNDANQFVSLGDFEFVDANAASSCAVVRGKKLLPCGRKFFGKRQRRGRCGIRGINSRRRTA